MASCQTAASEKVAARWRANCACSHGASGVGERIMANVWDDWGEAMADALMRAKTISGRGAAVGMSDGRMAMFASFCGVTARRPIHALPEKKSR